MKRKMIVLTLSFVFSATTLAATSTDPDRASDNVAEIKKGRNLNEKLTKLRQVKAAIETEQKKQIKKRTLTKEKFRRQAQIKNALRVIPSAVTATADEEAFDKTKCAAYRANLAYSFYPQADVVPANPEPAYVTALDIINSLCE